MVRPNETYIRLYIRYGIVLWDFRIGCHREYWGKWRELNHNSYIPTKRIWPLVQCKCEYIPDRAMDNYQRATICIAKFGMTVAEAGRRLLQINKRSK